MNCELIEGWNIGDCCISCHEDWEEFGYYGCSIEVGEEELMVCCRCYEYINSAENKPGLRTERADKKEREG